jgi:hypothetical protein
MKMSDFEDFFNLLRLYEGVVIENWHIFNEKESETLTESGTLTLRISEPKSIVRLLYICLSVNMRYGVYAESLPVDMDSMEEILRRLVWTFTFRGVKNGFDVPGEFKFFCIHMVWDLGKRGLLNESEYVRLLSLWKGFNWMREERLREKGITVIRNRLMNNARLNENTARFLLDIPDAHVSRAAYLIDEFSKMLGVPRDTLIYDEPFDTMLRVKVSDLGEKEEYPGELIRPCPSPDSILGEDFCEKLYGNSEKWKNLEEWEKCEEWKKFEGHIMKMNLAQFVKFFAPLIKIPKDSKQERSGAL